MRFAILVVGIAALFLATLIGVALNSSADRTHCWDTTQETQ
jgi:hypothetical protein